MSASEAHYQPNLTPILDMVFQLITFFMLVVSFKTAAMDLTVHLPVLGSARPEHNVPGGSVLVLNVDEQGAVRTYGELVDDLPRYMRAEAHAERLRHEREGNAEAAAEIPTTVVIRAERTIPFRLLNEVISACQKAGFQHFNYRAANPQGG